MNDKVLIALSTQADGSMSKAIDDNQRFENRKKYLEKLSIAPEQTVLVHLLYDGNDYRRYFTITGDQAGDGIIRPASLVSDGLFTLDKNLALLLPVADCIGAVLYDSVQQVFGVGHLGRHNLLQQGGSGLIEYMMQEFGSDPRNIEVWLSPAAGRENYPLYDFENASMHEIAQRQLLAAGVAGEAITVDNRDTTTDEALFSHSEFLKGHRMLDGRQAVVAMMKL